jgi:hypothetical protein
LGAESVDVRAAVLEVEGLLERAVVDNDVLATDERARNDVEGR